MNFGGHGELADVATVLGGVITQPISKYLAIGDRGFAKAEQSADFRAMTQRQRAG